MFYKYLDFRNNLVQDISNMYKKNSVSSVKDIEKYILKQLSIIDADSEDKTDIYMDVLMELNEMSWFRRLSKSSSIRNRKMEV